jgi:hypothetical protein
LAVINGKGGFELFVSFELVIIGNASLEHIAVPAKLVAAR